MKFSVHVPGWQFAETWEGDSVADVKQRLRDELCVKRLPPGTEVWEYTGPPPGWNDPYSATRYMM